jgi:deoxyribonuclease V
MDLPDLHSWDLDYPKAWALQESLASSLEIHRPLRSWKTVAAADASYNKFDTDLFAAVVVIDATTFEVIERVGLKTTATFPYIPGMLSFREAPPVLECFRRLKTTPDVVLCDGQGYAHPRRLGLASHIGLWLGIPTIGCAKSRLCGEYVEPASERGCASELVDGEETVGVVLRTRAKVKPLFVSVGNHCDLESSIRVVLASTPKYRLPHPSRLAHEHVNDLRREAKARAD